MKIGDKVAVIDDDFQGIIVNIKNDLVDIETIDGFVLSYNKSELVPIHYDRLIENNAGFQAVENAKKEKQNHKTNHRAIKKSKKEERTLEVDLHIEKLMTNFRHLSNIDIINIQIDTATRQLDFAIKNRFAKVVFIHGMGEGVLKTEIEFMLSKYTDITFQDADYMRYGLGATEVFIRQAPLL